MKRSFLLFVVLALMLGMIIPSGVFADNNTSTPTFDNNVPKMEQTKTSVVHRLFGDIFVIDLPWDYDIIVISLPWDDDPAGSQHPPGVNGDISNRRPGGDDHGWIDGE